METTQAFRKKIALALRVAVVLTLCTISIARATSLAVQPANPTAGQPITIVGFIDGGPFLLDSSSLSYSIQGNVVRVNLLQNGFDFGPNPPFTVFWNIGPLPAGTYTVLFESRITANGPIIASSSLTFSVVAPASIPALSVPSLIMLSILLLLFGFRLRVKRSGT